MMPLPSRSSRYAGNRRPSSRPSASEHVKSPFAFRSQYAKSSLVWRLCRALHKRHYQVGYGLGVLDRGKLSFELGVDA